MSRRHGRPGARITQEDVAGLSEISALPRRGGDGRDSLQLRLPSGRHHLVALTWGASAIVVGATRRRSAWSGPSAPCPPPGCTTRCSWPGCGPPTPPTRWSAGPVVSVAAPGASMTTRAASRSPSGRRRRPSRSVAVYPHPGERLTAPAALVRVPGRGVAVSYRIRRAGPAAPPAADRRAHLRTAHPACPRSCSCGPPARTPPTTRPKARRSGGSSRSPSRPASRWRSPSNCARGRAWLACFVDPGAPVADARAILLFPPPAGEMRIR